jgi:lipid-A-disaccharide synthase
VLHLHKHPPDLTIFIDFGAFHVRVAKVLRLFGYRGPILDLFPPGAWFDQAKRAHTVASAMIPVTAFKHQRDFYRDLGLRVEYFGHPLAAQYTPREPRPPAAPDNGVVALLPGSRPQELRYNLPALAQAFLELRNLRPNVRGVIAAADAKARCAIERTLAEHHLENAVRIVDGAREALNAADAAWVASGTAVLEAVLTGVPTIAFYIINPRLVRYAKSIYRGRFYTLPNLVLDREVVPELMQERASPQALARAADALLRDPQQSAAEYRAVREALGEGDALPRIAAFAVALAKEQRR